MAIIVGTRVKFVRITGQCHPDVRPEYESHLGKTGTVYECYSDGDGYAVQMDDNRTISVYPDEVEEVN